MLLQFTPFLKMNITFNAVGAKYDADHVSDKYSSGVNRESMRFFVQLF